MVDSMPDVLPTPKTNDEKAYVKIQEMIGILGSMKKALRVKMSSKMENAAISVDLTDAQKTSVATAFDTFKTDFNTAASELKTLLGGN